MELDLPFTSHILSAIKSIYIFSLYQTNKNYKMKSYRMPS